MSDKKRKNAKIGDEIEFRWLKPRGKPTNETVFYNSFVFDGVKYSLYDCVYLFKKGETEPYVGKLVRIWENLTTGGKVAKVLWFFRPSEISNYLQGLNVLKNEIFLATGDGAGLSNVNNLEAIAGKCNVVCISEDVRNRQPSNEELELADYVFYRTFNVKNLSISDKLDEKIATIDVELLLNKKKRQSVDRAKLDNANLTADVKTLISAKDAVVADTLVDCNMTVASLVVEADKLTEDILNLPKCHPSENLGIAMANNSVLVAGVEKTRTSKKDTHESGGDVKFDAGLGSLWGYEKKQLTEKGDAVSNENSSVVPSTSKCVLGSCQQITSKSSDSKQTELNKVGEGTVTVTATGNGKPEPVNDVKKHTVNADKAKSENRPSKKLKLDVSAQNLIVSGTKKFVNVSLASNNVNRPANGQSSDRPEKVSLKQPKDKDLANRVSKAPQRPDGAAESKDKDRVTLLRERDGTSEGIFKKRRTNSIIEHQSTNKLGKEIKQPKDEGIGGYAQVKEVTQLPLDTSKWFTDGLWEDRIKGANDQEKLVLLQNLDPTYNSEEVESIIRDGFHESCTVKIVQHTATSSPHAGQAFAIFSNREVAKMVIRKLEQDCLMLPNGRPLVGTNYSMTLHGKQSQYFGHIVIEKPRQQKQKDMREAVSTSHSAQPNTLEYEMALEWRLLQDRSDLCWKYLYQNQGGEIRKLKVALKSK